MSLGRRLISQYQVAQLAQKTSLTGVVEFSNEGAGFHMRVDDAFLSEARHPNPRLFVTLDAAYRVANKLGLKGMNVNLGQTMN